MAIKSLGSTWWHIPLISGDKQIFEFKASLGQSKFKIEKGLGPGVVVHTFNPRTQETEACRSLSSWSIYRASFRTARKNYTETSCLEKDQKTKQKQENKPKQSKSLNSVISMS